MTIATRAISLAGHVLPATRAQRLLILIYHRVRPQRDPMFPLEVTAEKFDRQVGLLARHFEPMTLQDSMSRLRDGVLPPRAVAITFDDGYRDNAEVAVPILRRHGVPATFFIATGFLDGGRMWNDTIIESLRLAKADAIDLSCVGLGRQELGAPVDRGRLAEKVLQAVKHKAPEERQALVDEVRRLAGLEPPDDLMMSSRQVSEMSALGMEIGAHTVTHPILRTLSDEAATHEIAGSREVLQEIVQKEVSSFAYPNGRPGDDYSERDRDIVAKLGFAQAVSTTRGVVCKTADEFQLPRLTPWAKTPSAWLAKLLAAYSRRP